MALTIRDPVAKITQRTPVCVEPTDTMRRVAQRLWSESVGVAIVGDVHDPKGLISERDVVTSLARGDDADSTTAGSVMTDYVISAHGQDPIFDVVPEMIDDGIRHMPIIDDDGTVIGMVSMRDLMNPLLLDALSGRSRVIRIDSYEFGRIVIDGMEERRTPKGTGSRSPISTRHSRSILNCWSSELLDESGVRWAATLNLTC